MSAMIRVMNLVKEFGPFRAVDDISFDVAKGEVLGFLGPNGAGKSTTMKMITGFLPPTGGRIEVCGLDVAEDPLGIKRRIGYLPEGAPAYPDMTVAAFLRFVAQVRGYGGTELAGRIDRAVEQVHLDQVMTQSIDTLSKGFKRRVGLAQALLHDPEVLIMDEPTDGLDPNQKFEVRNLIADMAKEKAIIISTHILEEVEAVCSRAVIIARGRIVADGTPDELEARSDWHNAVSISLGADLAADAKSKITALDGVARVEERPAPDGLAAMTAFPVGGRAIIGPVAHLAREQGWECNELHVEQGRLDEVFRRVTTEARP